MRIFDIMRRATAGSPTNMDPVPVGMQTPVGVADSATLNRSAVALEQAHQLNDALRRLHRALHGTDLPVSEVDVDRVLWQQLFDDYEGRQELEIGFGAMTVFRPPVESMPASQWTNVVASFDATPENVNAFIRLLQDAANSAEFRRQSPGGSFHGRPDDVVEDIVVPGIARINGGSDVRLTSY